MDYIRLHPWDVSVDRAAKIQKDLSTHVRVQKRRGRVELIAGADLSFERFSDTVHAGFVVLDARSMQIVSRSSAIVDVHFPYIPGFLTFREGPALIKAWENLDVDPDVVIFDGQGIAHPRAMGIASHLGLFLDRPTIGCGKTLLVGTYPELPREAGAAEPLIYKGNPVGYALRTKDDCKPVFVSPGHLIDAEDALEIVRKCVRGYRIPEPTRQAHIWVNQLRLEERKKIA